MKTYTPDRSIANQSLPSWRVAMEKLGNGLILIVRDIPLASDTKKLLGLSSKDDVTLDLLDLATDEIAKKGELPPGYFNLLPDRVTRLLRQTTPQKQAHTSIERNIVKTAAALMAELGRTTAIENETNSYQYAELKRTLLSIFGQTNHPTFRLMCKALHANPHKPFLIIKGHGQLNLTTGQSATIGEKGNNNNIELQTLVNQIPPHKYSAIVLFSCDLGRTIFNNPTGSPIFANRSSTVLDKQAATDPVVFPA